MADAHEVSDVDSKNPLYMAGRARGFSDEPIPSHILRQYPTDFIRGYRHGKTAIDQLVDVAAQSRCFD